LQSFKQCVMRLLVFFLILMLLAVPSMYGQGEKSLTIKQSTSTDTLKGRKFALIIGVSSYEDKKLSKLNYAHTDAQNFRNFLLQGYAGHIENPVTDIKYLVEEKAMYDSVTTAIAKWLMKLRGRVKAGDVIYIYYSGHGVVSPEGQNLLPIDSKIADESLAELENNVALANIRTMVASLVTVERGVKVYYIIDACRKNEGGGESLTTANKIAAEFPSPGEYFFYAASDDQYSYESKDLGTGNGVYTYFFLLGLKGAADKYPADNKISIEELEEFVQDNVRNYTRMVLKAIPQKPVFKNVKDNDRQRILAVVPKDTVTKYQKLYDDLKKKLLSKSFRNELRNESDVNGFLAAKGLAPFFHASTHLAQHSIAAAPPTNNFHNNEIYTQFLEALNRKHLIEPKGNAAYDYYQKLVLQNPEGEITNAANEQLFAALVSKTQKVIDNYIFGKLPDRSKKTFDLAYNELLTARNLIEEDNPYRKTLNPKLYFLHARALAGSSNPRDWDKGLRIIDSALAVAPKAAYSHYTKGILFVSKHRFFSAIKHFTKATEIAPNWTYALYNLAKAYYDVAEYEKSIAYSKRAITKDSLYSEAYSLIALNYENIKMYDSAIYWNQQALAIDSSNTYANFNIGRIYIKWQQNTTMARKYFSHGAYAFNDVASLSMLGFVFYQQRQYDSAMHYYKLALNIDPFHHETIGRYAELVSITEGPKYGDAVYLDAIKNMGNDSRIFSQYMAYKFSQKSYAAADSLFNELISFNNEDPSIFINYSQLLESNNELQKARNVLHNGLYYVNNSPSTIFSLANLYFRHYRNPAFQQHGLDSSLYYFKRSRQITPTYSFTHFGLYQVNFTMNNIDSAIISLQNARAINPYIQKITNYNPDILAIADKALAEKKYLLAIKYYELSRQFNNDFKTNWKLALVHYLAGDLNKAEQHLNETGLMAKAKSQQMDYQRLLANILFDQKKFSQALIIFKQLDNDDPLANNIEQAATEFMLANLVKAKSLLSEGLEVNATALQHFLAMEGIRYSSFLINTVKKLNDSK